MSMTDTLYKALDGLRPMHGGDGRYPNSVWKGVA